MNIPLIAKPHVFTSGEGGERPKDKRLFIFLMETV